MLTLFLPNMTATQTGDEYIRLFLQFDQICKSGYDLNEDMSSISGAHLGWLDSA